MKAAGVSVQGRATQGVRVMRLTDDERVVAVERIAEPEEAEVLAGNETSEALLEGETEMQIDSENETDEPSAPDTEENNSEEQ